MLEQNKININLQNAYSKINAESPADENVTIHTMQDDLNSLSGIFSKNENTASPNSDNPRSNFKSGERPRNEQYFNPFLDKQAAPIQEKTADLTSKNNIPADIPAKKEAITPNSPSNILKPNLFAKKTVLVVVILIVVAASFIGGYYFWIEREAPVVVDKNQEEVKPEEIKTEESSEVKNIESIPKYLSNKPNFLPIDTENYSYENLKNSVTQVALEIKKLGIKEPVEFIITNSERTPVQFSIFKTLAGIKLSDNLMKTLGDDFSIFSFHEAENLRVSLLIKVADQTKTVSLIKSEEPKLIAELSPLFFEGLTLPKEKIEFKDNDYKGVKIRYFNLTSDHSTSIDYAFINGKLIIGTSKNSIWAAIDKILDDGR